MPDPAERDDVDAGAVARRLDDERRDVEARLEAMNRDLAAVFDAADGSNADDEHDPEGQTIAYERSQLAGIDEAQQRLQLGT